MKKILIVEDDKVVAGIYQCKFAMAGFEVKIAKDGKQGLEMARQFQPDLMQLDLMLPVMDGAELIRQLRALPEFKMLPIIVVTNAYLPKMVENAWKAGATRCLSKSDANPKQLIELMERCLSGEVAPPVAMATSMPARAPSPPPAPEPAKAPAAEPGKVPVSTFDNAADAEFQESLRRSFMENSASNVGALRAVLHQLLKAADDTAKLAAIMELLRRVRSMASNAGLSGIKVVAHFLVALEALLIELQNKPSQVTPSSMRTVAQAVDTVEKLIREEQQGTVVETPTSEILVVEDEEISRRAIVYALEKASLKCLAIDEPNAALTVLENNRFDLIFLDVDMPGMSGHELCKKMRTFSAHEKTPVVFVTGLSDFKNRALSTLSGGQDLIAKPFLFMELAVKALIHLHRDPAAK